MAKLENKIIKKLEEEERISHIPAEEASQIQMNTHERMVKYARLLVKRTHASHQNYKMVLVQRIISPTAH